MKLWSWGDFDNGDMTMVDVPADDENLPESKRRVTITFADDGTTIELPLAHARSLHKQLGTLIDYVGESFGPTELERED